LRVLGVEVLNDFGGFFHCVIITLAWLVADAEIATTIVEMNVI